MTYQDKKRFNYDDVTDIEPVPAKPSGTESRPRAESEELSDARDIVTLTPKDRADDGREGSYQDEEIYGPRSAPRQTVRTNFLGAGLGAGGMLLYFAYSILSMIILGNAICWFFDIENFFLRIFAFVIGLFLINIPIIGLGALAVCAYYIAEVLDWGWIIAICFTFPGLAFTALAFFGSALSALKAKYFP